MNSYLSRTNRLHYTYAIATNGLIKVGFTSYIKRRINWYKTHDKNHEILMIRESSIASLEEQNLIKGMKDRVKGREWFKDTPENREYIAKFKIVG